MPSIEILKGILDIIWQLFRAWWWIPLPVLLFLFLKHLYLYYIEDRWWAGIKWVMLEIKIPREVERPMKAMEQVISNFWTFYDPSDFKEKWFEGKFLLTISLEIVSIDGVVHLFLRVPAGLRKMFESAIYSQYPDVEIEEVPDYTKQVPQNLPNQDWDTWACNFAMPQKDCYPIKTYATFFEPTQEIEEEKRIDPLAVLIEGMSRLKKGEQLWLQIMIKPVTDKEYDWVTKGKEVVDKLLHRSPEPKPKSITGEAIRTLTLKDYQPFTEEKKEEGVIPPEMKLSPGEREVVQAIETKLSKQGFLSNVRMVYLGKRDIFFRSNLKLILNFSSGISTQNLNSLKPVDTTKVVPPAMFRLRRLYRKQRRLFREYLNRWTPFYPRQKAKRTYALNTEEVATLFHFPSRLGAPTPTFPRIEAKKGGAPPALPTE